MTYRRMKHLPAFALASWFFGSIGGIVLGAATGNGLLEFLCINSLFVSIIVAALYDSEML